MGFTLLYWAAQLIYCAVLVPMPASYLNLVLFHLSILKHLEFKIWAELPHYFPQILLVLIPLLITISNLIHQCLLLIDFNLIQLC